MRAVIGLPPSHGSEMEEAGQPPSKYSVLHTTLSISTVSDAYEKTRNIHSFPLINLSLSHLMYLFLMNTQVGFKIHQEQNKHYLS